MRSRSIPWIVHGPGIRKNFDLARLGKKHNVETYDTFATACAVLGIAVKGQIEGKFVSEILEERDLLQVK